MPQYVKKGLVFCFAALLSGCASLQLNNLFSDYATSQQPVRQALTAGDIDGAQAKADKPKPGNTNYQLALLEQGRLAFLAQDFKQSQWWFDQSYQALEQERAKAKVRLGKGVEKFNTLVTNDNAISYQPPAYEQSMMHSYQALNYAFKGDLEGALVEVRRANFIQEQALKSYESELLEASNEAGIDPSYINNAAATLNSRIGDVKNGFQNAYTFYLSGVLYEAAGQLNDAYIDYKRAVEIYPDNEYLQRDILRLGSELGMQTDLETFKKQFSVNAKRFGADEGQLVVIYEQGLIDAKVEKSLRLPIFTSGNDMRFYSVAIPSYEVSNFVEKPLLLEQNTEILETQPIVNLQALVAKQLQDSMTGMLSRQVLRLVAKEQVRRKLSKEGGDVGNILAGLYSIASERADTRSWLTLPSDVQVMRTSFKAGTHSIKLGGSTIPATDIQIKAGKITLMLVTQVGQLSHVNTVTL
ncbi:COG3014 family protein [Thalassotalea euphylliae]|uniref:COG3014 family protein n=1 Tax=Thalassotalea euphylliae TaxID=1655234 RepID=UPI00362BDFE8